MNETGEMALMEYEENLQKYFNRLIDEFMMIRVGRANPRLIENIKVDYYGTMTPLDQIGNISTPDAKQIVVQPWEKSLLGAIGKAIQAANLGFMPKVEADVVRIVLPPVTEERRKELCKKAKAEAENAKVAVRNIRRNVLEKVKKLKDNGTPEDEVKTLEKEVQDVTDKFVKKADEIVSAKEKEIMSI